jgi:thiol-disulfide isomerase/thioredoxin
MIDKTGAKQYDKAMKPRTPKILASLFLAWVLVALPAVAAGAAEGLEANSGHGGETLDLQSLRVQGKTTVVEFFSPFCPPCLQLAPLLAQLPQKRPDLAVRKVNINRPETKGIDWQSPLAQQYQIHFVPYFVIFSPRGKTVEGKAASKQVLDWLVEAGLLQK